MYLTDIRDDIKRNILSLTANHSQPRQLIITPPPSQSADHNLLSQSADHNPPPNQLIITPLPIS